MIEYSAAPELDHVINCWRHFWTGEVRIVEAFDVIYLAMEEISLMIHKFLFSKNVEVLHSHGISTKLMWKSLPEIVPPPVESAAARTFLWH